MELNFPAQPQAERRNSRRWVLPFGCASANLHRPGQPDPALHGPVFDISWGGVRFELKQPIKAGETVDVEVTLSADKTGLLRATGRVVRFLGESDDAPTQIAIAFTQMHDPGSEAQLGRRIHDALNAQGPRPAA